MKTLIVLLAIAPLTLFAKPKCLCVASIMQDAKLGKSKVCQIDSNLCIFISDEGWYEKKSVISCDKFFSFQRIAMRQAEAQQKIAMKYFKKPQLQSKVVNK